MPGVTSLHLREQTLEKFNFKETRTPSSVGEVSNNFLKGASTIKNANTKAVEITVLLVSNNKSDVIEVKKHLEKTMGVGCTIASSKHIKMGCLL